MKYKMKGKPKLNKKRVIQSIIIAVVVLAVGVVGVLAFSVYKDTEAFSAEKLASSGASQLIDNNGDVMYTYGSAENGKRKNVTYNDLPQVLIDAVVAAEDSRFFEHNGFDLPRIVKAAIGNLASGGITSGGSTITQQVVKKSYFPDAQRTYSRKFSEIILAIRADKALSKEEIITLYLNKIYFGRSTSSIGVGAASLYYFNKDVSELTLPEAALLAGSLNSPYNYDPYYNLDKATERRNRILNLMVKHGYITQEEATEAKAVKVENMLCASNIQNDSYLSAYVDMVTSEVIEKTGLDPRSTQMNIYTYCDPETQKLCYDLNTGVTYNYSDEDLNMGGAVQSSQDGRVVAVLGGRNFVQTGTNYATTKQQPGSSVKPFLDYGLAFEYLDWCTEHTISDEAYTYAGTNKSVKNWDGQYHGDVTIPDALLNSWNIPALKALDAVQKEVKKSDIVKALESVGIDMSKEEFNTAYGIGGWATGISPIEMASTYATITNGGMYVESHTVNYAEDVQTGKKYMIDEEIQDAKKQSSYSAASSFMIRQTMIDYTSRGSGSYASLSGLKNVGSKTGTSNFSGSSYVRDGKDRDAWMTAFSPDYVVSVWMGFTPDGIKKGKNTSDYKAYPNKVVSAIMRHLASGGYKKSYPSKPDDVVQAQIVKGVYPYVSPSSDTPSDMILTAWFKKGTTPKSTHDSSSLNLSQLSSFEASLDSSNKIAVKFAPYSPIEATTNDQANEGTKMYGKVVYTVQIVDSNSGATLHTENLSSNTGTINYTVNGQVKVIGYYSYSNAPGKTSNKIEKTLGKTESQLSELQGTVTADGSTVSEGSTISATSVYVAITPQDNSHTFKITLYSSTGEEITSSSSKSATINSLVPGSSYSIVMSESDGSKTVTKKINFTVK